MKNQKRQSTAAGHEGWDLIQWEAFPLHKEMVSQRRGAMCYQGRYAHMLPLEMTNAGDSSDTNLPVTQQPGGQRDALEW